MIKKFLKKYKFFITTVVLSLTIFLPSLINFSIKCHKYELKVSDSYVNDYSIEKREVCSEINHNSKPLLYMYFGVYLFCAIFFLILRILEIKYFFDKYIFSMTLLIISIFIPSFTSFSYTIFYFYYSVFLFSEYPVCSASGSVTVFVENKNHSN